jgi:hypothetical protein
MNPFFAISFLSYNTPWFFCLEKACYEKEERTTLPKLSKRKFHVCAALSCSRPFRKAACCCFSPESAGTINHVSMQNICFQHGVHVSYVFAPLEEKLIS